MVSAVEIRLPCGLRVPIPVQGREGEGRSTKYGGDHPSDVTSGLEFIAASFPASEGISLVTKEGIGRYVRNTPRFVAGAPAISCTAYSCIQGAVEEALKITDLPGVIIELRVPRGKEVALNTLNAQVGIEGGISLLGTTGFVEPWDDHLTQSLLDIVKDAERLVLTTGRIGLRYSRLLFPDHTVVLAGGKFSQALPVAPGEVVLCGLPGLILRSINPGILEGTPYRTIEEMMEDPTFQKRAHESIAIFRKRNPHVRVVLIDRRGSVVVDSI
jgi:cobalt-precorrin-5B (C1)-methyltransferase